MNEEKKNKNRKPLGRKSYGSIPHFKESKQGPGEHHITPGQQRIATQKARDGNDLIIVQEKLDGSNVGITLINGEIVALTRAGYEATASPYKQHHYFNQWANRIDNQLRFKLLLSEGERVCGEWMLQAHGTKYNLPHEPFVVFDLFTRDNERLAYHDFLLRVLPHGFIVPGLIHLGQPYPLEKAIGAMRESKHGAVGGAEGVVYRVERNGKVDFLAKYIDPDREVGKYLDRDNIVWNYPIGVIEAEYGNGKEKENRNG